MKSWLYAPLALALACSAKAPAPPHAPEAGPASAPGAPETAQPSAGPRERPELREHFAAERVSGTIALLSGDDGSVSCSDVPKCESAYLPASTFKIPNSMIALELGVLEDPESSLPWDGKTYSVADWNRDHTLRSAMQVSCVPCFQDVARRIGEARMKEWLERLEYGNHDLSGGIDRFWLGGGLRISPIEQVRFLRRFDRGELPISERTSEYVRDIITLDVGATHVLRGKTGLLGAPEVTTPMGWFVGWVERGPSRLYFATFIDGRDADVELGPARRRVTERILRAIGALP